MNRITLSMISVLILVLTLGNDVRSEDTQPLTNADIVKLSSLGLGDDVVIAKIKQAKDVAFALDIADIEKLHNAGVSKPIIAAMLQRTTSREPDAGVRRPPIDVWTLVDGQPLEIPGIAGSVEASIGQAFKQAFLFSFKSKMAVIAQGTSAKTRLSASPTVFYTRYRPSEIGVARFTVQSDRNRRYFWLVAPMGATRGEVEPPEHDMKFTDERTDDGSYKLTFKAPFAPGEYVLVGPPVGRTGHVLHDFAVDPK
jgi:hypothetical protein